MLATAFEVTGYLKPRKFSALSEAALFCRERITETTSGIVMSIFNSEEGVLICVVSDDSNGVHLHALPTATEEERDVIESFN